MAHRTVCDRPMESTSAGAPAAVSAPRRARLHPGELEAREGVRKAIVHRGHEHGIPSRNVIDEHHADLVDACAAPAPRHSSDPPDDEHRDERLPGEPFKAHELFAAVEGSSSAIPAASVQAHASAPVDLATFRAMLSDVAELATEITAEYGRVAEFLNAELQGRA